MIDGFVSTILAKISLLSVVSVLLLDAVLHVSALSCGHVTK